MVEACRSMFHGVHSARKFPTLHVSNTGWSLCWRSPCCYVQTFCSPLTDAEQKGEKEVAERAAAELAALETGGADDEPSSTMTTARRRRCTTTTTRAPLSWTSTSACWTARGRWPSSPSSWATTGGCGLSIASCGRDVLGQKQWPALYRQLRLCIRHDKWLSSACWLCANTGSVEMGRPSGNNRQ